MSPSSKWILPLSYLCLIVSVLFYCYQKDYAKVGDTNLICITNKSLKSVAVTKADIDIDSIVTRFSNKTSKVRGSVRLSSYYNYLVSEKDSIDHVSERQNEKCKYDNVSFEIINSYQNFTFDDPTSYQGYVIDAWPPSRDKNVTKYISEEFSHLPNRKFFKNKELVIIVQSHPSESDYRTMWRYFVGRFSNSLTSIIFLIGHHPSLTSKDHQLISKEIEKYDDIARVDGFIEHYHNLTLKSMYSLKLFLNEAWKPHPPKYMIKLDIDVFINIPKLFKEIIYNEKINNLEKFVLGHCDVPTSRIKQAGKRTSPPSDYSSYSEERKQEFLDDPYVKWVIPSYMYNNDTWPTYVNGPAYMLTRSSAKCMLQKSADIPYLAIEDVYTTGFLAQECSVPRLNHPGFDVLPLRFDYGKNIINHLDYTDCFLHTGDIKGCSYDRLEYMEKIMMANNQL